MYRFLIGLSAIGVLIVIVTLVIAPFKQLYFSTLYPKLSVNAVSNAPLFPNLSDTATNIHVGQVFNYLIPDPSSELGKVDYIFGSKYPAQPAGVYNTYYIPYSRDQRPGSYPEAHDITWWKANHPDWIEYQCDEKTVAYMFPLTDTNIPLDFTNPAEQSYIENIYLIPKLQVGYSGIAFDNVELYNFSGNNNTGGRCGHFDTSGNWVKQFNATWNDPSFRQAVIAWTKSIHNWMHTSFPNATMTINSSYVHDFLADSATLLNATDVFFDEGGFTNYGGSYTDSQWLEKVQLLQNFLSAGRGWLSSNEEPSSFGTWSHDQIQWVLANYLLLKNNASFVAMSGIQDYGSLRILPEYSAQIGSATNIMYQSQGVYMRDFSSGKAIVNPSSTQSFTISLPANVYTDLYGNSVNSKILGVQSGIVLLGIQPTPTPTSVSAEAAQPGKMPVSGYVSNNNSGAVIPGFSVEVYDDTLGSGKTVQSDNRGFWGVYNFVNLGDIFDVYPYDPPPPTGYLDPVILSNNASICDRPNRYYRTQSSNPTAPVVCNYHPHPNCASSGGCNFSFNPVPTPTP